MIRDALHYQSTHSYPYVVLTKLKNPKPEDVEEEFKRNQGFIRLPTPTLKVAIWGFEDEQDGLEFAKLYGLGDSYHVS